MVHRYSADVKGNFLIFYGNYALHFAIIDNCAPSFNFVRGGWTLPTKVFHLLHVAGSSPPTSEKTSSFAKR